jgi:Ca2+/H+ antiporter, TMEM165/GDT1 family
MQHWISLAPTVIASFMASMVEFVEALTIVLAVGIVRGWKSALIGTAAALVVLVALVASLGPSLAHIPLPIVQLAVGTLLLMFGLRWLRKAVLRASGVLPLHDEAKAFVAETESLRKRGTAAGGALDRVAFGASFKIVMLEGIEVVFIVIAVGAGGPLIVPASIGAGFALLVVVGLGLAIHRPLARVPENALKFGVGVLLSAFGTFWVGEGINLAWPGGDWAILLLIGVYLGVALALVPLCARARHRRIPGTVTAKPSGAAMGALGNVVRELWGLFVDDGLLAAAIPVLVAAAWAARAGTDFSTAGIAMTLTTALNAALAWSALRRASV